MPEERLSNGFSLDCQTVFKNGCSQQWPPWRERLMRPAMKFHRHRNKRLPDLCLSEFSGWFCQWESCPGRWTGYSLTDPRLDGIMRCPTDGHFSLIMISSWKVVGTKTRSELDFFTMEQKPISPSYRWGLPLLPEWTFMKNIKG